MLSYVVLVGLAEWGALTFDNVELGSYKDEVIIYSFIIVVIGLLVFAATKPYIETFLKVKVAESCGIRQMAYS